MIKVCQRNNKTNAEETVGTNHSDNNLCKQLKQQNEEVLNFYVTGDQEKFALFH